MKKIIINLYCGLCWIMGFTTTLIVVTCFPKKTAQKYEKWLNSL